MTFSVSSPFPVDQVGKDLSLGRAGSAPCHLSLSSLRHETALTSPWELDGNLCPFTVKLNHPRSLARTLLILTHGHCRVSATPVCSCPCGLSDSQWPAQTCEFTWPQRMKCATCRTGRPSGKGTSFPSWLSAVTRTSWDIEKTFPGIKVNEFSRCIQNKGGC